MREVEDPVGDFGWAGKHCAERMWRLLVRPTGAVTFAIGVARRGEVVVVGATPSRNPHIHIKIEDPTEWRILQKLLSWVGQYLHIPQL